jgi:uncharacterized protein (DUF1778 family)
MNFRLPAAIKQTIEEAAAQTGQTVTDFAISTLAETARRVLEEQHSTRLTTRDRARFMKILDDTEAKPNAALRRAAARYKRQVD